MNFPFLNSSFLDKIPFGPVNKAKNFAEDGNILHDMGKNTTKRRLSKNCSPSHIEEFGLPS